MSNNKIRYLNSLIKFQLLYPRTTLRLNFPVKKKGRHWSTDLGYRNWLGEDQPTLLRQKKTLVFWQGASGKAVKMESEKFIIIANPFDLSEFPVQYWWASDGFPSDTDPVTRPLFQSPHRHHLLLLAGRGLVLMFTKDYPILIPPVIPWVLYSLLLLVSSPQTQPIWWWRRLFRLGCCVGGTGGVILKPAKCKFSWVKPELSDIYSIPYLISS